MDTCRSRNAFTLLYRASVDSWTARLGQRGMCIRRRDNDCCMQVLPQRAVYTARKITQRYISFMPCHN